MYQKHAGSDGLLTYEEMCGLLFEMGSGNKDNTNPVYELAKSNNGWGTTQGMSKKLIWKTSILSIYVVPSVSFFIWYNLNLWKQ